MFSSAAANPSSSSPGCVADIARSHEDSTTSSGGRPQVLQLVDVQRSVGQLQRREQRAVGPHPAVAGEVRDRRAVDRPQDRADVRRSAVQRDRVRIQLGDRVQLRASVPQVRPGREHDAPAPVARAPGASARSPPTARSSAVVRAATAAAPTAARAAPRSERAPARGPPAATPAVRSAARQASARIGALRRAARSPGVRRGRAARSGRARTAATRVRSCTGSAAPSGCRVRRPPASTSAVSSPSSSISSSSARSSSASGQRPSRRDCVGARRAGATRRVPRERPDRRLERGLASDQRARRPTGAFCRADLDA